MLTDGWPVTAALDSVTGNPDVQYTSDEHAAILAGLIVRDVNGAPRAGVLPRHTDSLVTARPDMKVDVAPFEAVLVNAGIRMIALTEQITLDVAAAQVANTRYDIVYVEVTDRALTGVKSTSAVKVATGQASSIPQDPAVPAGAVRLARLTITANATATNSGVTITAIHQFTAATMGKTLFRTTAEMNAWAGTPGQAARTLDAGKEFVRVGSSWSSALTQFMKATPLTPPLSGALQPYGQLVLPAGTTWKLDGVVYFDVSVTTAGRYAVQLWNATAGAALVSSDAGPYSAPTAGHAYSVPVTDVFEAVVDTTIQLRARVTGGAGSQGVGASRLIATRGELLA